MNTYRFTHAGVEYEVNRQPAVPATVTGGGPWPEGARISPGRKPFEHVSAARLEILRLAARVRELEEAQRDALAERVKLLDRLEAENIRPAFEKIAALEAGLREAYWLTYDAWNKDRFGRHNAYEAKELRREMAGVLGRVGLESPGHPGQGVTEYPPPWAALEEENRRLREELGELRESEASLRESYRLYIARTEELEAEH